MKLAYLTACALAVSLGLGGCDQKPATEASNATQVAEVPQTLLAKYDCLKCHLIETRMVGPAFRDVALKYHDDPAANDHIVEVIKRGSKGVWGDVPMPPHPQIPEPDARRLAVWVMNCK
jgi:cytochrome c